MRRAAVVVVLIMVVAPMAGCLGGRTALNASIWNRTDEVIELDVILSRTDDGQEVFNRSVSVVPNGERRIDPLLEERGDHRLSVTTDGILESEEFYWSRQEGPDRVVIVVRSGEIDVSFEIV